MTDIKTLDQTYVAPTYGRFPVVITSGKGCIARDDQGKEYIDMGSGIGVNLFGYSDEIWKEAVTAQLNAVQHTSNLYYTGPCAELAELLCRRTGLKKVFFCNSGAEANECAVKAARRYAQLKKGDEYFTIITLNNSFHGRTLTTLAATGQEKFHQLFQPLTPGFISVDANDCEALVKAVEENRTAAIMLECVQGEGGVIPLSREFIDTAVKLAQENDLLIREPIDQVVMHYAKNAMESGLDELVTSDSIPFDTDKCPKVRILSLDKMFAHAIKHVNIKQSINDLFLFK